MHQKIVNKLRKAALSQDQILAEIAHENNALLNFKPDTGSWSILEVVEHCRNIDSSILQNLIQYKDYPSRPAGIKQNFNAFLLKLAFKGGFKFKVPPIEGLSPKGKSTAKEITSSWKAIREDMVAYLESFPAEKLGHAVFRHPRAGYITILQTLDFINIHTLHHHKQIRRNKAAFNNFRGS